TWYVGAITNQTARSLDLTLNFLTPGVTYSARLYSEPARNNIVVEERSVVQGDVVETSLLAGGGFAMQLTPAP
ncbi:MAG: glycoside hydrolase family 97 C-terminal domain-containing protein, partial [Caldilineaceae bacterium]